MDKGSMRKISVTEDMQPHGVSRAVFYISCF
jgi:hypothetical protein